MQMLRATALLAVLTWLVACSGGSGRETNIVIVDGAGFDAHTAEGGCADAACPAERAAARRCGAAALDCTALPGVRPDAVRCVDGVCDVATACIAGRVHCSSNPLDGCETDATSAAHCGSCSTRCDGTAPLCAPAATSESGGYRCVARCPASTTRCGDRCVDVATDARNCGACDRACPAGANAIASCAAGTCSTACAPGYLDCDRAAANGCEADTLRDPMNCGACGQSCQPPANGSASCSEGVCGVVCAASTKLCGVACLPNDRPETGCAETSCAPCPLAPNAMAMACGTTGACVVASCRAGYKLCGNVCVATSDPAYGCGGATCSACALAPNAMAMACGTTGACIVASCRAGYKVCGGACVPMDPAHGCRAASCGACAVQHAAGICSASGACDYTRCEANWRDLDGNRANGCETAAPPTLPGLKVWLSTREPGSLMTDSFCNPANCVQRWRNLADGTNDAVQPTRGIQPRTWQPAADGTAQAVIFAWDGVPPERYIGRVANSKQRLELNLGFMTRAPYTVFVVATPFSGENQYVLGCDPGGSLGADAAFHLGWPDTTTLRLGHWNADLNVASVARLTPTIVLARLGASGRTLTERGADGYFRIATDARTSMLSQANQCAVGRGPDSGAEYLYGFVYEVVIYNRALPDAETWQVETYLRRRYGL